MRRFAVITALLMMIVPAGWADHVREWQMSTRKPEKTLAGIRVGETTIDVARKRLGEPTRFQDLPEYPGEAEYVWEQDGLRVDLGTMYDPENRTAKGEIVYSVEVAGARASERYVTGAGVELGDDLSDLIRAYGPVYLTSWRPPSPEATTFTFLFRDETELSAGLSYEGRIVSLALIASVE